MDHFLFRLRRRPIAQTCRAFALAASCPYRLVRIELTLRLAPGRITPAELARLDRIRRRLPYLGIGGNARDLLAAFLKSHPAEPATPAIPAIPQSALPAADPTAIAPSPAVTAPFGFSDRLQDLPPVDVPPVHEVHPVHPVHPVHEVHPLPDTAPSSIPFAPDALRSCASPLLANLASALLNVKFTHPLYDLSRLHPFAASALLANPGATLVSVIRGLHRLERFYTDEALAQYQSPSSANPQSAISNLQQSSLSPANLLAAICSQQSDIPPPPSRILPPLPRNLSRAPSPSASLSAFHIPHLAFSQPPPRSLAIAVVKKPGVLVKGILLIGGCVRPGGADRPIPFSSGIRI